MEPNEILHKQNVCNMFPKVPAGDASLRPYKTYTGLLEQREFQDPTITILEDSVTGVKLTRASDGTYWAVSALFKPGKTVPMAMGPLLEENGNICGLATCSIDSGAYQNSDTVVIKTFRLSDLALRDSLLASPLAGIMNILEIRVYQD